jgi:acetolactate synthase-1/2/3 large subunit
MDTADLVLAVRSRVPWYPPNARPKGTVVAIGEQPFHGTMVYQNLQADIFLEGDAIHSLTTLADLVRAAKVDPARVDTRRKQCVAAHNKMRERLAAAAKPANGGISPPMLCQALNEVLPEGTIFIDETITHRPDTMQYLEPRGPRTYYRGGGGLGQGIGTALGVKLAAPDRVVCPVIGDGSFLYNPLVQSLALSQHANLPILAVVFNNGGYAAMREEHHAYYPEGVAKAKNQSYGFPITGFEYSDLAKPFGGHGKRVETPADLKPAIKKAAAAVKDGRTAILNVMLER